MCQICDFLSKLNAFLLRNRCVRVATYIAPGYINFVQKISNENIMCENVMTLRKNILISFYNLIPASLMVCSFFIPVSCQHIASVHLSA
jgi:hypothetical protein